MKKLKDALAVAARVGGRVVAATRKRVLLAFPVTAQWVGFGTAVAGLFLLVGLAWSLIVAGLSLFALGILVEGGRV
jgi:hypothetical protein